MKRAGPIFAIAALIAGVVGLSHMQPPQGRGPLPEPPPTTNRERATMAVAVPLIARWEGLRTEAYFDPVGVPTVCYGETLGVQLGQAYTEAQCQAMLEARVREFRNRLRPFFTADTRSRRLPPKRDAAFTSLAYNVGVSGAGNSTAVKRLNAANVPGACEALTWWNKAGGRVLRGLVRRRSEERQLCLEGVA